MTLAMAFAFLAGALGALALPPPYASSSALAVSAVAIVAMLAWRAGRSRATLLATATLAGLALAAIDASARLAARWPEARDGERVLASARIVSIPVDGEYGTGFDAALDIDPRAGGQALRARLVWLEPRPRPRVGEIWQLAVRLRAPRALANPGSVDMERIWFRDRIGALGTVLARSPLNHRLAPGAAPIDRLRALIAARITAVVADRDAAALLAALAVGVTGDMSREQWRVFAATGTTHLVAISGMHVTLFAVLAIAVARRLWRLAGPLRARVPRESFAAALGIAAASAYALLAGFSVPTQRTLIMLAAWLVARHAARAHGLLHAFAIAIVAVLLADPLAPLASGFWLSFGAVAAILLVTGARLGRASWWHEAVRVQAAVTIALVPVTLAAFGSVSLASLVVNAAAIPVFTLLLVPLALGSTAALAFAPALAEAGFRCGAWLHALLWPWLEAAAAWPHALVMLTPPAWAYLLAVPAVAIAILPWPRGLRLTAAAAVLPLAFSRPAVTASAPATATVFDVGRGHAVAVRLGTQVIVHGTGESFGTGGRRMARVIVPWLRSQRIDHVDVLVMPRLGGDTAGGAAELEVALGIGRILVPRPWSGGPEKAVPCDTYAPVLQSTTGIRLAENCDLTLELGAWRVMVDRRGVRLGDAAGEARLDPAHRGAITLDIDAAGKALRRHAARDGYPWPWRAPV